MASAEDTALQTTSTSWAIITYVAVSERRREEGEEARGGERRREEGGWRGGERVSRDTMSNHYVCGESGKGGASNTIT